MDEQISIGEETKKNSGLYLNFSNLLKKFRNY